MKEIKVVLSNNDEVTLTEPNAGARNKALIKSVEYIEGRQEVNVLKFLTELLPMMVSNHPWGLIPVNVALEKLSTKDYDSLVDELRKLISLDEFVKKN